MTTTQRTKIFRPRGIEADGLKYYQEQDKAGDYLSIDPATLEYYLKHTGKALFEARATANCWLAPECLYYQRAYRLVT